MPRVMQPAVYIMANKRNGTLYVGVTSNLGQRVGQHRQRRTARQQAHHQAVEAIARAELKRRGTIIPSLDISGHALDRASLRLLDRWKHREDQEQGLHAWLEGQAKEALRTGKESQPGKRIHNGVWFVFEMDGEWPVLKSVYPA